MNKANKKKIIRLLGVGFDADDGHVRITNSERYDVIMGSDESHDYIQKLIQKIEDALEAENLRLDELTPEEFREFVKKVM